MDTAFRELKEETGIVPTEADYILNTVFVLFRDNSQVIIYFILVVAKKPEIIISEDELDGYTWISRKTKLDLTLTEPTVQVLHELGNVCR